jgi:outer membrane protein assembly factor BamB
VRRSIIPFLVGSERVASLQDLKRVISEKPEELVIPLQDGRLERFLNGISSRYVECIDRSNPRDSIKRLAEKLGVKIKKELELDDISAVDSAKELMKLFEKGKEEINIAKGTIEIDKLILKNPIRLRGQGKNETLLRIGELFAPYGFRFTLEHLTCEVENFVSSKEPDIKDAFFNFSNKIPVATSSEELLQLLEKKEKTIYLTEGKFDLENLKISASKLIGTGRDKTILQVKKLMIPKEVVFENLTCHAEFFLSSSIMNVKTECGNFYFERRTLGEIGTLRWKFRTGDRIRSSPAVGSDGTIYVGSDDGYFYAINPDGSLKWKFKTGKEWIRSSPAVGSDGTIYVGSNDGYFYAINPDGSLKWKFKNNGGWIRSSPAVGSDGTIYVGSNDYYLYAFNPNGTLKWKLKLVSYIYVESSPAVDEENNIYIGSHDRTLHSISMNGVLKWKFKDGWFGLGTVSSPAINGDGVIYIGSRNSYLYALNPNGTVRWKIFTKKEVNSSPAIGSDGTIYVGSDDYHLYAVNPNGTLKWKFKTGGKVVSSPAIGSDGTIYVGSDDYHLYAINPNGTLKWKFKTGGKVVSSPAITEEGIIYVGSDDGYLYAIYSDSFGLADSTWPMFRCDLKHNGRVK